MVGNPSSSPLIKCIFISFFIYIIWLCLWIREFERLEEFKVGEARYNVDNRGSKRKEINEKLF